MREDGAADRGRLVPDVEVDCNYDYRIVDTYYRSNCTEKTLKVRRT